MENKNIENWKTTYKENEQNGLSNITFCNQSNIKLRIFIRPGITDMRKQVNGLYTIVKENMELDPYSGNLFLFAGRRRNLIKILRWDKNGYCLWLKRLERDRFSWPSIHKKDFELSSEEFHYLLQGKDFFHKPEEFSYNKH